MLFFVSILDDFTSSRFSQYASGFSPVFSQRTFHKIPLRTMSFDTAWRREKFIGARRFRVVVSCGMTEKNFFDMFVCQFAPHQQFDLHESCHQHLFYRLGGMPYVCCVSNTSYYNYSLKSAQDPTECLVECGMRLTWNTDLWLWIF